MDAPGLKIGSYTLPSWALAVGAGGLVLILLLRKGGSEVTETDKGTGLLAAEFDQRLTEQWNAWFKWFQEWIGSNDGSPIDPPGEEPHDTRFPEPQTCAPGYVWSNLLQKCIYIGQPGTPVPIDPVIYDPTNPTPVPIPYEPPWEPSPIVPTPGDPFTPPAPPVLPIAPAE